MDYLLLMTGTPIQNNTDEIFTMFNLLDRVEFGHNRTRKLFREEYGELDDPQQVENLKTLLRSRMLRRMKDDVFTGVEAVPAKQETIIWVELTARQKELYRGLLDRRRGALQGKGDRYDRVGKLNNLDMELRKLCNHPVLVDGAEDLIADAVEREIKLASKSDDEAEAYAREETYVRCCGKMVLLNILLPKLKAEGHKVLIFSQMTRMLDLLQDYLEQRSYPCERLDGSVSGHDRQAAIDRFSAKSPSKRENTFVFLLSTRAGGVGINLTAADTVIIYDSDWNPQNDLQAMARCHRIGQDKQVTIYRLVTKMSYEEGMFKKSMSKLTMDQLLLTAEGAGADIIAKPKQKELENLIKFGAYDILKEETEAEVASATFGAQGIDAILASNTETIASGEQHSSFSKAPFAAPDANSNNMDINDPEFWSKVGGDKWASDALAAEEEEWGGRKKRTAAMQHKEYNPNYDDDAFDDFLSADEDADSEEEGRGRKKGKGGGGEAAKSRTRNRPSRAKVGLGLKCWNKVERERYRKEMLRLGPGRPDEILDNHSFRRSVPEARAFERALGAVMAEACDCAAQDSTAEGAGIVGATVAMAAAATMRLQVMREELEPGTEVEAELEGRWLAATVSGAGGGAGGGARVALVEYDTGTHVRLQWAAEVTPRPAHNEVPIGSLYHLRAKFQVLADPQFIEYLQKPTIRLKDQQSLNAMGRLQRLLARTVTNNQSAHTISAA